MLYKQTKNYVKKLVGKYIKYDSIEKFKEKTIPDTYTAALTSENYNLYINESYDRLLEVKGKGIFILNRA